MECCALLNYSVFAGILYGIFLLLQKIASRRKLDRWNKSPKDVVILHGLPRQENIFLGSPFVLKLETYLRMANIPYTYDPVDCFGPAGKTPWISLNGEHVTDSEIIIKFLSKKFEKNLNMNYSEEKLAIGTTVRIMAEEHIYWGLMRALFVEDSRHEATKSLKYPAGRWLILYMIRRTYKKYLWGQGLGRLSNEDTIMLMKKEIRALATILGNNKFLLGNEPSEVDAAIFGFMSSCVFGPEIKDYAFVRRDHPNLVEYCKRMRDKFWKDWDQPLN